MVWPPATALGARSWLLACAARCARRREASESPSDSEVGLWLRVRGQRPGTRGAPAFAAGCEVIVRHLADTLPCSTRRAGSTLRSSRAVPHPSTDWALRRFTSEVGRDPVHSTRYGRQRLGARDARGCCDWLGAGRQSEVGSQLQAWCVSGSSFARMAVRRKAVRMHARAAPGSKLAGVSGERSWQHPEVCAV